MKHILIITSFLLLFCSIAQAQLPTVEELVDSVEQNFHPIQRLETSITKSHYIPSSGFEPPDTLYYRVSTLQPLLYFYPDTTFTVMLDTTITDIPDTTILIRKSYKRVEGNRTYVRDSLYFSDPDTTIENDTGFQLESVTEDRNWYIDYSGGFPERLFFRFGEFVNNCYQAWVSENPGPDIYIISVHYSRVQGNETRSRRDFYIDYGSGTIVQIKYYDTGIDRQRTPENMILEGEDVFSDFQQVEGIWLPHRRVRYDFGNPSGEPPQPIRPTSRTEYTYTFIVVP